MKSVTYKRIGISLVVLSAVVTASLTYLAVVNLIPPAIDALMDSQITIAASAQGIDRE